MLALARKVNQSIMIGDDIAPKSIPVYRKEIYLQIQEENKQAGQEVDIAKIRDLFEKKSKDK